MSTLLPASTMRETPHLFRPVYDGDYFLGRDDDVYCDRCGDRQNEGIHADDEDESDD